MTPVDETFGVISLFWLTKPGSYTCVVRPSLPVIKRLRRGQRTCLCILLISVLKPSVHHIPLPKQVWGFERTASWPDILVVLLIMLSTSINAGLCIGLNNGRAEAPSLLCHIAYLFGCRPSSLGSSESRSMFLIFLHS